tara:strand:- start:147 stop:635 length:489 start_codon:yes stop_codon:yes gene_type:complete
MQPKRVEMDYLYGEIKGIEQSIKALELNKDSIVFDIGVGKGTFLCQLLKTVGCKGIGVEPQSNRIVEARQLRKKYNLENDLELINAHYPCKIGSTPTHAILHGCAMQAKTIDSIYKALPSGIKILHNSPHLRKAYHKEKQAKEVRIPTNYVPTGSLFYVFKK